MNYYNPNPPSDSQTYLALPAQLIEIEEGVIIKRGCTEVKVVGDKVGEIVNAVWTLAVEQGVTIPDILSRFAEPDHESLEKMLNHLISRQFLVASDSSVAPTGEQESSLDVFYWHFGSTEKAVNDNLQEKQIVIFGVNTISARLTQSLQSSGFEHIQVVDFPTLRNLDFFDESTIDHTKWSSNLPKVVDYSEWSANADLDDMDCIIATTDFANTVAMQQWNRFAIDNNVPFLPIMLRRMVGYVGPFVIPDETPCYQCLIQRENAHFGDETQLKRESEQVAFYGQNNEGFHPLLASMLGDVGAMEVVKYFSQSLPYKVGHLIEVNMLAPLMKARKVLRAPRCLHCGKTMERPAASLEKADFMPGSSFIAGESQYGDPQQMFEERFNR